MAGAAPEHDVVLDDGEPAHFCSSGCAAFVLDHETGERRHSTLADLQAATVLLDEVPEVDVMWTTITANDVPVEVRELVGLLHGAHASRASTSRSSTARRRPSRCCGSWTSSAGDREAFRARPRFSTLLTAASPLRIDGPLLDFHAATAADGAPVEVYTVPMAGATAPVTRRRDHRPGARRVPGRRHRAAGAGARGERASSARLGRHHGHALRRRLLRRARVRAHGRRLRRARRTTSACRRRCPASRTDAKYAGIQAGYEKALKGLATAGVGADVLSGGVGMIDSVNTLFLPQIVHRRRDRRHDPPRARRGRPRATR